MSLRAIATEPGMKQRIRQYLIRQGIIKPESIAETRAIFPFPYDRIETKVSGIAISRSMEALHYVHGKSK